MLPKYYSNYFQPFSREFVNPKPCQMMQCYNMRRQKPLQTQQQPIDFSSNFEQAPGSPTDLGIAYTQGYLKTQIGKRMRITFILGTNQIQDRQGTLEEVGISYIVIKDLDTTTSTLCDIYSIKFVTIYP